MTALPALLLAVQGLGATAMVQPTVSSTPVVVPPAAVSATMTAASAPVPVTVTTTGAAVAPVSASPSVSSGGWSESELGWLRCKHSAHVRDRDEGWSFDAWMNPARCPGDFWTGPARDAWDRYLKRARGYDECIRDRRTRKVRSFIYGAAAGALVTGAMMGILRQGSDTEKLVAVPGVGLVTGSLWWWRERGRPDPVCRTEPATEWPK